MKRTAKEFNKCNVFTRLRDGMVTSSGSGRSTLVQARHLALDPFFRMNASAIGNGVVYVMKFRGKLERHLPMAVSVAVRPDGKQVLV